MALQAVLQKSNGECYQLHRVLGPRLIYCHSELLASVAFPSERDNNLPVYIGQPPQ
jgi:hypothetical protein